MEADLRPATADHSGLTSTGVALLVSPGLPVMSGYPSGRSHEARPFPSPPQIPFKPDASGGTRPQSPDDARARASAIVFDA